MLKTNTKKARENIKNYITENFDNEISIDYGYKTPENFSDIATSIYKVFWEEKGKWESKRISILDSFIDWCAGLPSILDTCYFYNRSAVDDLGNILEETTTERNMYTESQAELLLTQLIYREIIKNMEA